jgi:predicted nucleic acid-binding protein
MRLVDANLLLYAHHPRAEQNEKSRAWLEAALSGHVHSIPSI